MYTSDTLANYLLADTHRKVSHMSNTTLAKANCQVLPLKEKMQAGLTTADLNAIISEISGKPRLQDTTPKPLPPTDPNSVEANFPSKDPFRTKETPISKVIEACNQSAESPTKAKSIGESKKLLTSFKENLATYPKPLTYEGAVVFCVAISVNEGTSISLNGLPQVDRELVLSQLPPDAALLLADGKASINVDFDEMRDFILTYHTAKNEPVKLKYFNTVIHPQKLPETNVPVEKEGGKVTVGTHLVLDQRRIAKLVGIAPHEKHKDKEEEEDAPRRRQPVAGRNAYEIRADVLQMAIDWIRDKDEYNQKDENDVLQLAKKFYSFVEDRRR